MIKSEKHLLSFEIKVQRPGRLWKTLIASSCQTSCVSSKISTEFNKLYFPLCCLDAEFNASCAGVEWPFQETHFTGPTCINPVFHLMILQVMAFTEKVRLCDYNPGFNIMEKSSWAIESVPQNAMTSYNSGWAREMVGAEVDTSQEAATKPHLSWNSTYSPTNFSCWACRIVHDILAKSFGVNEDTRQKLSLQSCGFALCCTGEAQVQLSTCVPSQ